jgi:hypothetical protein
VDRPIESPVVLAEFVESHEHAFPSAVLGPATVSRIGGLPGTIEGFRDVAPPGAGTENPDDRADHLPVVTVISPPTVVRRHHVANFCPFVVVKWLASHRNTSVVLSTSLATHQSDRYDAFHYFLSDRP